MKRYIYEIRNVDCAQCAKHLETSIARIKGFTNVSYNFATMKLTFETDRTDDFYQELKRAVYNTEPDAEIVHDNSKASSVKKFFNLDFFIFLIGAIVGFIGLFVPMPVWTSLVLVSIGMCLLLWKTAYKACVQLFKSKNIGENLLITIAVLGAFGLGLFNTIVEEGFLALGEGIEECLMVIILYNIGKMLEASVLANSRKNISNLMEIQPDFAMLVHGNHEHKVHPDEVKIGSIIKVRPGERVPLDGIVTSGSASCDISHLTGESLPISMSKGSQVLAGTILLDGILEIETTSLYRESAVARIMNLIDNANDKKSKTETFINKFAKWYTLAVIGLAVVVFFGSWILGKPLTSGLYYALILLFISCPCAFAISVPLAYFSALGKASKNGILIKGSNYLDVSAKLNRVIFDKTGTLTTGQFVVRDIVSLDSKYSTQDVLELAVLGEQNSIHPIARAIQHRAHGLPIEEVQDFVENSGKGVSYTYKGDAIFVGNVSRNSADELTSIQIFVNEKPIGKILLADSLKTNSVALCEYLKANKVNLSMLSGDNNQVTSHVAQSLGIDDYKAGLTPEQKYAVLEEDLKKQKAGSYTAFVGDGINDAPSLSRADLGISMGLAGSPATVEASDIVVVDDDPGKIKDLHKLSKFTRRVVWENIVFALVTKILIIVLELCGVFSEGMLIAVFADVGVTLLAILNSLRILQYKFGKKKTETQNNLNTIEQK